MSCLLSSLYACAVALAPSGPGAFQRSLTLEFSFDSDSEVEAANANVRVAAIMRSSGGGDKYAPTRVAGPNDAAIRGERKANANALD